MNQDQVEWIISATTEKLMDSLKKNQITEIEYSTEITKLNLWAEKAYKQIEKEHQIEQEVLEEQY
jgi:hypothetical protein